MSLTERLRNWRIKRGIKKGGRKDSLYNLVREQGYSGTDLDTLLLLARNMESLFAFRSPDDAKLVGEFFGRAMESCYSPRGDDSKQHEFSWKLSSFGMHDRFTDYLERVKSGVISEAAYERIVDEMCTYKMMYLINFEFGNQYTGKNVDTLIALSNVLEDGFVFGNSGCSGDTPDKLGRSVHYARRVLEVTNDNLVFLIQLDIPKHEWNIAFAEKRGSLLEELAGRYNDDARNLTEVALFGFLGDIETIEQYDRGLELLHHARDLYRAGTSDSVQLSIRQKDVKIRPEDNKYLFCLENLANLEFKRSRIERAYDRGIDSTYCYKGGHRYRSTWQENPQYQSHLEEAISLFKELYEATKEESRIPEDLRDRVFGTSVSGATSTFYDPFEVLGLDRKVGYDEAKKAFRKRALETHPDRHGGDKLKEEEFKKVYQAWQDVQTFYQKN